MSLCAKVAFATRCAERVQEFVPKSDREAVKDLLLIARASSERDHVIVKGNVRRVFNAAAASTAAATLSYAEAAAAEAAVASASAAYSSASAAYISAMAVGKPGEARAAAETADTEAFIAYERALRAIVAAKSRHVSEKMPIEVKTRFVMAALFDIEMLKDITGVVNFDWLGPLWPGDEPNSCTLRFSLNLAFPIEASDDQIEAVATEIALKLNQIYQDNGGKRLMVDDAKLFEPAEELV